MPACTPLRRATFVRASPIDSESLLLQFSVTRSSYITFNELLSHRSVVWVSAPSWAPLDSGLWSPGLRIILTRSGTPRLHLKLDFFGISKKVSSPVRTRALHCPVFSRCRLLLAAVSSERAIPGCCQGRPGDQDQGMKVKFGSRCCIQVQVSSTSTAREVSKFRYLHVLKMSIA